MLFYGLPQLGPDVRRVHRRLAVGDALGRRVQQRELPRRLPGACRSGTARRRYALGFGPLGTFLNVTLPLGGRIALPSSINTYISVLKNTSLMYVIAYPELTTTAINISNITLETAEASTFLGIVYLTLVWSMSFGMRRLERHLALPEAALNARLVWPRRRTTSCTRGCRTRFGWRRSPSSRAP